MITLRQQQVTVDRLDMIQAVKAGQAKHISEYTEAKADYEAVLLSEFTRVRDQIAAGNFKDTSVHVPAPQDHSADYAEVIEMMEMSVDKNLTLDREAFKAYFKNEWSWSRNFAETAGFYKATLAAASL
jgi:roadblock/LC7 domain-containing protein